MTRDQFVQQLAMMLAELPRGTTADLNECMVAYWNGSEVVFAFPSECGTDAIEEEFDIDDYVWQEWQPTFENWISSPSSSHRPEVLAWLRDAPPHEAGG